MKYFLSAYYVSGTVLFINMRNAAENKTGKALACLYAAHILELNSPIWLPSATPGCSAFEALPVPTETC